MDPFKTTPKMHLPQIQIKWTVWRLSYIFKVEWYTLRDHNSVKTIFAPFWKRVYYKK